jgi:hypothetical protein
VTVQAAGYTNSETLTNFPLRVALGTNVSGFTYASVGANWYSLRFTDDQGRRLAHEVQNWNTNGTSCVWVCVQELTNSALLHAYWGNASVVDPPAYALDGSVWKPGYDGVWHLEPGLAESSGLSPTAADYGSTSVTGAVLEARKFDGTNAYVDPGVAAGWYGANSDHLTVSFWIKPGRLSQGDTVFGSETLGYDTSGALPSNRCLSVYAYTNDDAKEWTMMVHDSARTLASYKKVVPGAWAQMTSQWHLVSLVMSNGLAYGSVDEGARSASAAYSDLALGVAPLLGKRNGGTNTYAGSIDEFRLARVARSVAWVKAEYSTIMKSTFVQYGVVGPAGPANPDADGDGLPDAWEQQQFGTLSRPGPGDYDNDSLSDEEEYARGTSPTNSDTDVDGMYDGWEVLHGMNVVSNDAALDKDEDGMLNAEEYTAGTDPELPGSYFAVGLTSSGGQMFVQFNALTAQGVPGYSNRFRYYGLLTATNLMSNQWSFIDSYSNLFAGTNAVVTYTNAPAADQAPALFKGEVQLQ